MKILLMIFLLPMTVCTAMPMYGSASATIENRKGFYIFPPKDAPEAGEGVDGSMVDVDFDSGADFTELFTTPDYESDLIVEDREPTLVFDSEENLIVDEPDAEGQNLADTLLSDDVREE